jgi:hypothetical protein
VIQRELFGSGADEEDGDGGLMADFVDGAAENEVAHQAVAVRGHGDQVAMLLTRDAQNLGGGVSQGEMRHGAQAEGVQGGGFFVQVGLVLFHFLGLGQLHFLVVAGGPAISDVEEKEFGLEMAGQFRDVREEGFVGPAVFQRHENFFIHDNLAGE